MKYYRERYTGIFAESEVNRKLVEAFIEELNKENMQFRTVIRNQRNQLRHLNKMCMYWSARWEAQLARTQHFSKAHREELEKFREYRAAGPKLMEALKINSNEFRYRKLYEAALEDLDKLRHQPLTSAPSFWTKLFRK